MAVKKVLGWGWKKSSEKIDDVLCMYYSYDGRENYFHKSRKDAKMNAELSKKDGSLSKKAKVKIFKLVVEVES